MTKEELFEIKITEPDARAYARAKAVFDSLAKPLDGFGDFEDIICRIKAMRAEDGPGSSSSKMDHKPRPLGPPAKALVILLADNGVAKSGVSQTDPSVTVSVARLMSKRRSSAGVMTEGYPVEILSVDVGMDTDETIQGIISMKVAKGTGNIVCEPAMTGEQCLRAIEAGMDTVRMCRDRGIGIIATGEMGIGNTTTATALMCALTGQKPADVTGRGAGLSDEGLLTKIRVIEEALAFHGLGTDAPDPEYAFTALRCVGGLDIAALAGVFIACALYRIPCVIDGLISAVAAYSAELMVSGCRNYMIASHTGRERGCSILLGHLGLKGVIDADMALGEGTGALMLFPLLDMVTSVYEDGTSFDDADIAQYERFADADSSKG